MLHPAAPAPRRAAPPRKRGSYSCGRCGLPKRGHICPHPEVPTPPRALRRALSFDDELPDLPPAESTLDPTEESETLDPTVEVLRRLPPKDLMAAAAVCRGWRECAKKVWSCVEEFRLRVSPQSQIGFVGSVLNKCIRLSRLTLTMESDVDAMMLACVAFSCSNLEVFEINVTGDAINRITGDQLGRFVAEKRRLSILKVEGCTSLGFLNVCSSSLSTLWLSDLYCLSKATISCPNLKELSLDFRRQENDSTDLVTMMDSLGRSCPRLRNMHVSSIRLCNEAVLALAGANLSDLRMLSLVLGSTITDASVAAIISCYTSLELLDLSGSNISDSGIGMICNAFPQTLSRLLLALCPNITSSGVQFATAQLPLLQLMDCGMSIQDLDPQNENLEESMMDNHEGIGEFESCKKLPSVPTTRSNQMYQKLIIKHGRLKKVSLWGCSGLDALCLSCPELIDLNLISCTNLHPEKLLLQCPKLKIVHASGCHDMLIGAIRNQVLNEFANEEHHLPPCKRSADGSKRVNVPHSLEQQPFNDEKRKKVHTSQCIIHID